MWRLGGEREGSIDIFDVTKPDAYIHKDLSTGALAFALDDTFLYTVTEVDTELDSSLVLEKFRLFPEEQDIYVADAVPVDSSDNNTDDNTDITQKRLQ
jgi:hypothetical protein